MFTLQHLVIWDNSGNNQYESFSVKSLPSRKFNSVANNCYSRLKWLNDFISKCYFYLHTKGYEKCKFVIQDFFKSLDTGPHSPSPTLFLAKLFKLVNYVRMSGEIINFLIIGYDVPSHACHVE